MDDRIAIRAHYERFPATVKGAFVVRGADADPHQVRIESARIAEVAGRGGRPIEMEPVTLEVAPHVDTFVPFEFPLTDLGPGWYELACDLLVDGVPDDARLGSAFPVPWPRATVRRGSVAVAKAVAAGGRRVHIEQVECSGDSIKVSYTAEAPAVMKLAADGGALAVIDERFDEALGRGKITAYPVMKTHERLAIEVRGANAPIEVKLP